MSSNTRGQSYSLTSYNPQRSRSQKFSSTTPEDIHAYLPPTTHSDPEVSNCLVQYPWSVMLTYYLQPTAIQRSETFSSNTRGWSSLLTRYNPQRSRGQKLSCPIPVVSHVHLLPTTHSDPEVSNCLVQYAWLIMFTYHLQPTAIQRSEIASFNTRGGSCSLTSYNPQRFRGQKLPRPIPAVDL